MTRNCAKLLWVLGFIVLSLHSGQCHYQTGSGVGEKKQGKQNLRNIIYCNFLKHGESRPLILSHVRVSRGPYDDPAIPDEEDPSSYNRGTLHTYPIKSPSYQHKINHISQFHSTPGHSDVTFSLRPHSHTIYPVASVHAKGGDSRRNYFIQGPSLNMDDLSSANNNNNNYPSDDPQAPTFTPYISSRILSNIPKFFEHLHENLKAIHDSTELIPSSESISVENNSFLDDDSSLESHMDMPTRRGDYFVSDGRLSEQEGGYQYDKDNHNNNFDYPHKPPGQYNQQHTSDEMLAFMGRDPKYKKANNYNPSWLFTNLGLGKRNTPNHPVHFSRQGRK